jgi:hypothetical protein
MRITALDSSSARTGTNLIIIRDSHWHIRIKRVLTWFFISSKLFAFHNPKQVLSLRRGFLFNCYLLAFLSFISFVSSTSDCHDFRNALRAHQRLHAISSRVRHHSNYLENCPHSRPYRTCLHSSDGMLIRSGSDNETLPGCDVDQCFSMPVSMNHIDACYPSADPALTDELGTLSPQSTSVPLPTSQVWGEWQRSPILVAPVLPSKAANATIHDFDDSIQRFPPTPPFTQSYVVPPVSTPYCHFSDYSYPFIPAITQSESTESICGPLTIISPSPFKPTIASDAVKKSSMKRRKHKAKFVCSTCGADFTAKHNLKSVYLTSAPVHSYLS